MAVGMRIGGAWELGSYNSLPSLNYGVAAMPSGPGGHTTAVQGSGFGISRQSKHKEEAWLFMTELMGQKGMQEIWAPTTLPARSTALPKFVELGLKGRNRDELYKSIDMAVLGRPIQPPGEQAFIKATSPFFGDFLNSKISPIELAQGVKTAFRAIKK
jgi:multiple sugar transport system substrate-binding protein